MYRYALTIEYDGSPFHGWQVQNNIATVQGVIFEAIKNLDKNCENFVGAGRTDAGVHAIGQVAHIDLETKRDCETVQKAINYYLNNYPISILSAKYVSIKFFSEKQI
jgi:tRNA pseudouridine38-40 synthase